MIKIKAAEEVRLCLNKDENDKKFCWKQYKKGQYNNIFKVLKGNKYQPRILYQENTFQK